MSITVLSIYDRFKHPYFNLDETWDDFSTPRQDLAKPLSERVADFSIQTRGQSNSIVLKIIKLILQIVIFPWGIYSVTRYALQRIAMLGICPPQSQFAKWLAPYVYELNKPSGKKAETLNKFLLAHKIDNICILNNYSIFPLIIREVVLEKNGERYQGMIVSNLDIVRNGTWAIHAMANQATLESIIEKVGSSYVRNSINVLFINPPSVSLSKGHANLNTIVGSYELGVRFLEEALQAKNIIFSGRSLGAGIIGEVARRHKCLPRCKYLTVRIVPFNRLSDQAMEMFSRYSKIFADAIPSIFRWTQCEIDCVDASRELAKKGIFEIVLQAIRPKTALSERKIRVLVNGSKLCAEPIRASNQIRDDGVIYPCTSLAQDLLDREILEHKGIYGIPNIPSVGTGNHMRRCYLNEAARLASKKIIEMNTSNMPSL